MAVFNLELSQGAKAMSIFLLMVLVWLQQALTWRYIQLRPDLNEPPSKERFDANGKRIPLRKHHLRRRTVMRRG